MKAGRSNKTFCCIVCHIVEADRGGGGENRQIRQCIRDLSSFRRGSLTSLFQCYRSLKLTAERRRERPIRQRIRGRCSSRRGSCTSTFQRFETCMLLDLIEPS